MSTRTIRELIIDSKVGNTRSTEELLHRLGGKLWHLARKWRSRLHNLDAEDLFQEASLEVLTAISTWKDGEAPFEAYLHTLVTNRFSELIAEQRTLKQGSGIRPLSLSEAPIDTTVPDPERSAVFNLTLNGLLSKLEPLERQVYELMISGCSISEMVETTQLSRYRVNQLRAQVRLILAPLRKEE